MSQDGLSVLVTDHNTGQVTSIDPATMDTVNRRFGASLLVVASGSVAYVVDTATGVVSRVDPRTLAIIRPQLHVDGRIGGAGIAADGTLWLALPPSGRLLPIRGTSAGQAVSVAPAGHALSLTIAGGRPVGVDSTAGALIPLAADGHPAPLSLPAPAGGGRRLLVADRLDGEIVPLVVAGTETMFVVDLGSRTVSRVNLAGQNPSVSLGAPVVNGGRIYLADNGRGRLLVYTAKGAHGPAFERTIAVGPAGDGLLTVFVRNNTVWVNNATGAAALDIDAAGAVHQVDKYSPDARRVMARNHNFALPPPIVVPASNLQTTVPGKTPTGPTPTTTVRPPTGKSGGGNKNPLPPVAPPPAVPSVKVTLVGAGPSVNVTVVPGAGGGPVSRYTISVTPLSPADTLTEDGPTRFTVTLATCGSRTYTAIASGPGGQSTSPAVKAGQCVTVPPPDPPLVTAQPASGAISVTLAAATTGGPATSFTVTDAGTTMTLTAPGTITIPVAGCATATASATASGPGGTSNPSTPAQALGCIPPGPVTALSGTHQPLGDLGEFTDRITWQPPTDTGGAITDYVIVSYTEVDGAPDLIQRTTTTEPGYEFTGATTDQHTYRWDISAENVAGAGPSLTISRSELTTIGRVP